MRRKTVILLGAVAVAVLGVIAAEPRINFFMLTGRCFPIQKIEKLQSPVAVRSWSADGLRLADGRMVQLPGFHSLPGDSAALAEATRRGVEVGADGRVWGLVKVHHWCGNDPVREHIAKVDLSDMMMFLRVGEPVAPVSGKEIASLEPGGSFSKWGWRIEEFMQFESWESIKSSTP